MTGLSIEETWPIAAAVLERHGLSPDEDQLSLIADALGIASDDELFIVKARRHLHREHEARINRLQLLESLLEAYWDETGEEGAYMKDVGWFQSRHEIDLYVHHGRDLIAVLNDLERLRDAENRALETSYAEPFPNRRPTSAKNAGAVNIYRILSEMGLTAGKAAGVIAEMLIDAGIQTADRDKVRRALYDKLKRLEW